MGDEAGGASRVAGGGEGERVLAGVQLPRARRRLLAGTFGGSSFASFLRGIGIAFLVQELAFDGIVGFTSINERLVSFIFQ